MDILDVLLKGASVTRIAALEAASRIISAGGLTFSSDCLLQVKDGGILYHRSCEMFEWNDYLIVIPEHSEVTVQHKNELEYWARYTHAPIPVWKD